MTDTNDTGKELAVASTVGQRSWERRQLCRELAAGEHTHSQLAKKYGLTRQAITAFKKRHEREIDDIRADLDDEFAGLWIAQKSHRIAAYQEEFEQSASGEYAGHFEHVRTRATILNNVAKELGQDKESGAAVQHVIVGVQLDVLQ